jgi:hypothetical protein
MGLTSNGGVHSSFDHLFKLCEIAQAYGIDNTFIHCFMDGRDTDPKSGKGFIEQLSAHTQKTAGKIATIIGRYYAMDRDKRWERVKEAYDLLVNGVGAEATDMVQAVQDSYDAGVTDEFIKAICHVDENGKPLGDLEDLLHMVNWGQVMMVGYIMVVSTQMMAPATGISAFTANIIKPFMTLPPVVFIIVVMTFCMVLTNVANNMLATVLCMPFMVNFATMIGMNPIGMVCLLFIISEFALATPAASPVTAVAMSQDYVTSNKMSVAGIKLVIPLFIVFMIVAWPLQGIIF